MKIITDFRFFFSFRLKTGFWNANQCFNISSQRHSIFVIIEPKINVSTIWKIDHKSDSFCKYFSHFVLSPANINENTSIKNRFEMRAKEDRRKHIQFSQNYVSTFPIFSPKTFQSDFNKRWSRGAHSITTKGVIFATPQ